VVRASGAPSGGRARGAHHTIHQTIMRATLGRLLQVIGMILLPIGLSYGLLKDNIRVEVQLLFIGGFLFVLGWLFSRERR